MPRLTPRLIAVLLASITACRGTCTFTPQDRIMTQTHPLTLPGQPAFDAALTQKLFAALAAQGKDYEPRTHHKTKDGGPEFINRLIFETSPYLLQHAHNPVNWYAWGKEAFETAKRLGRPILLSVGYSTCHWCHVMERESFEDQEIAGYINANYVAIKVDREERPDVDSVYMTAVQLMTGRGGWPMTVVMTPDGRPYFAGTYFPARDGDRGSRVGFLTILQRLKEAYDEEQDKVLQSADRLVDALGKLNQKQGGVDTPGQEALILTARNLAERYDPKWGGFDGAPKFPRPSTYEFLLRYGRRSQDAGAVRIVAESLKHMANGGIYDHVGGGFARYSTDKKWLVPHFEKMLYDNAQLTALLVDTWQTTGDAFFKTVATDVLDYVLKEMTSEQGAFYSATDADSEGEEGKFFVWSEAEIDEVLGPDLGRIARAYYGVTAGGNFEGHNILHRMIPEPQVAQRLGISADDLHQKIAEARVKLYDARKKRIPPLLDDKILTEWNAQMIGALAKAGFAFDAPQYTQAAARAADFILTTMKQDGRLLRAYRSVEGKGAAKHMGVLEDYAFFIAALLDLYEATGQLRWLDEALALQKTIEAQFWDDEHGAFFGTADDAEALLIREKPLYDGAQPSGNSVAAMNLLRLYEFTTDPRYQERAQRTLWTFGESLQKGAMECPKLAQALDFSLDQPKEVVIVTHDTDDGAALKDVLRKTYLPNRVLITVAEKDVATLQTRVPLVEGKRAMKDKATAYVCLAQTCKRPTSDPQEFAQQLAETHPLQALPLPIPGTKN